MRIKFLLLIVKSKVSQLLNFQIQKMKFNHLRQRMKSMKKKFNNSRKIASKLRLKISRSMNKYRNT